VLSRHQAKSAELSAGGKAAARKPDERVLRGRDRLRLLPDAAEYAAARTTYVKAGHGTPPAGATPIQE